MQFAVLGPLEIRAAGVPVAVGGARPQMILAALLLRPNQLLPSDALIDLVWGEHPPRTAGNVLQAHIARVRRALERAESGAGALVETVGSGYRLSVEAAQHDALRFQDLVAQADELINTQPAGAAELLRRALDIWRGEVLVGMPLPPQLRSQAARLEETRFAALERRLELDLATNHPAAVAAELDSLVREQPLRERLLWLRMLALYRDGRQAEALAAYRQGRLVIVEELGIEPGPELQDLERAILTKSDDLAPVAVSHFETSAGGRQPQQPDEKAALRHNLPPELNSFVGREAELLQLQEALSQSRLVTIVGPGGSGKTRLARRLALGLMDEWRDGAWLVDLSSLVDGDGIVDAIASALGVREQPGRPLFETLRGHLRERRLLLVLDTCDHLVQGCARLAEALLLATPISILATSREPLRIAAEVSFQLAPLALPPPDEDDPVRLLEAEAVQLLVERSQAMRPPVSLGRGEVSALAAIARRLDGLPLALEMAAARLPAFSPQEILSRLDDRFGLLSSRERTALPRHRTLRTTIDWSFELLEPTNRKLLRRLSIFAAECGLPDIEHVCGGEDLLAPELYEGIAQLVGRSLLVALPGAEGETVYILLDTVREYARVKLREAQEEAEMVGRHIAWCVAIAQSSYDAHIGNEGPLVTSITRRLPDFRAALEHAAGLSDGRELHLAGLLGWYWLASGRMSEGRERTRRALDQEGAEVDRARALTALGGIEPMVGHGDDAIAVLDEAAVSWRRLGDRAEEAAALDALGWAHFWPGHDTDAYQAFASGLAVARDLGIPALTMRLLAGLCQVLVATGEVERARPLAEELARDAPEGDFRTAHFGHHFLADCALMRGDCGAAASEYAVALRLAQAMEDPTEIGVELQGVAMAQAGLSRARDALRIAGAAEASFERLEIEIEVPFWLALLDRWLGTARASLPDAASAWAEGRKMDLESAAELALSLPGG